MLRLLQDACAGEDEDDDEGEESPLSDTDHLPQPQCAAAVALSQPARPLLLWEAEATEQEVRVLCHWRLFRPECSGLPLLLPARADAGGREDWILRGQGD